MKKVLLFALLSFPITIHTQTPPIRVAVSSTSTVEMTDLHRAFHRKCPNVILNHDSSRADFALEAIQRTRSPFDAGEVSRYRSTLFDRRGSTIYSTAPYKFSSGFNNVCRALVERMERSLR